MNYDKYFNRIGSDSVKWDLGKIIYNKDNILPMWVADMDFKAPKEVINAVKKRASHGIFGYTLQSQRFNEAIINWFVDNHKIDISMMYIHAVPGVVSGISALLNSICTKNSKVVIMPPVYYMFDKLIKANGFVTEVCPLNFDKNRYYIDFEHLEKCFENGAATLIFCSPHNPVCRVWCRDEISKVVSLCKKYNVLLISDEIHSDLIMNVEDHISAAGFDYENIVTFGSPSKTFNLAGVHIGFCITENSDIYRKMWDFCDSTGIFGVNPISQEAAIASYTYGKKWLMNLKKYIRGNYDFLKKYLYCRSSDFSVMALDATYLVWIRLNNSKLYGTNLKNCFLDRGLWIDEGAIFGEGGEKFIRMNIACPRFLLKKGLDILTEANIFY